MIKSLEGCARGKVGSASWKVLLCKSNGKKAPGLADNIKVHIKETDWEDTYWIYQASSEAVRPQSKHNDMDN